MDTLHPNDSASQFGAGGNGGGAVPQEGIAVAKKSPLLRGASIRHKMGVSMGGHKSHIRLAVQFINDSFQLRDMRLFEMNADQMRVDQLQGSTAYNALLQLLIWIHLMTFAYDRSGAFLWDNSDHLRMLDLVLLFFFLVHSLLKIFSFGGLRNFLSQGSANKTVFLLVTVLELATISFPVFFFIAIVRPLLLYTQSRTLRQTFLTILRCCPRSSRVFILFFCMLVLYSGVGMVLFAGQYPQGLSRTDGNSAGLNTQHVFDLFGSAFLNVFVLTTTENYPGIMMPAFQANAIIACIYFISFLVLVVFLIFPLFTGVIYDEWKAEHHEQCVRNRVTVYQALITAFQVLVEVETPGQGEVRQRTLNMGLWLELLRELQPHRTQEEAAQLFHFLDPSGDNSIDVREWTLGLRDVLRFNFEEYKMWLWLQKRAWHHGINDSCFEEVLQLVFSKHFERFINWVVYAHTLTLFWPSVTNGGSSTTAPNTEHRPVPDVGQGALPEEPGTKHALFVVWLTIFAVEMVLKMSAHGPRAFWVKSRAHRYDLIIVLLTVVAEIVHSLADTPGCRSPMPGVVASNCHTDLAATKLLLLCRTFLVMRLMTLNKQLLKLLVSITTVWRTIILFLVATFLVTYTYAVIGVYAFVSLPNSIQQHVDMSTFGEGMLQLFQHITTNNWNSIMFPNIYQCNFNNQWTGAGLGGDDDGKLPTPQTANGGPCPNEPGWVGQMATGFYFIFFWFIISFVELNILGALVIDAIAASHDRQGDSELDRPAAVRSNDDLGRESSARGTPAVFAMDAEGRQSHLRAFLDQHSDATAAMLGNAVPGRSSSNLGIRTGSQLGNPSGGVGGQSGPASTYYRYHKENMRHLDWSLFGLDELNEQSSPNMPEQVLQMLHGSLSEVDIRLAKTENSFVRATTNSIVHAVVGFISGLCCCSRRSRKQAMGQSWRNHTGRRGSANGSTAQLAQPLLPGGSGAPAQADPPANPVQPRWEPSMQQLAMLRHQQYQQGSQAGQQGGLQGAPC